MELDRLISRLSLGLGALGVLAAILTGFFGELITSIVIAASVVVLWLGWITYSLIRISRRFQEEQKASVAVISGEDTISYDPVFHELQERTLLINSKTRKIKIPADFLGWEKFTILFWVRTTEEYFASRNYRYIFSYTSNTANASKHPDSFYLGVKGGETTWRFNVSGENPANLESMTWGSGSNLLGWKLFAIRWNSNNSELSLLIDAGRVHRDQRHIQSDYWPRVVSNCQFHLGGWQDDWDGGLSRLEFYNFRLYKQILSSDDIERVMEREGRPLRNTSVNK